MKSSRKTGALTLSLLLVTSIALGIAVSVPYASAQGSASYFLTEQLTWTDAEQAAVHAGGHLVTINDAAEQQLLVNLFGSNEPFWIGLNDAQNEGIFVWVSGQPVTFTHWCGGEPNNSPPGEDYAVIEPDSVCPGNAWNDIPGTELHRGIVELSVPAAVGGEILHIKTTATFIQILLISALFGSAAIIAVGAPKVIKKAT